MNIASNIIKLDAWRERSGLVVFIRHGERESVPSGELPRHDAPLTENGRRAAESLGTLLRDRLGAVRSSPVPRCVDTALAVISGAQRASVPHHDHLLVTPAPMLLTANSRCPSWSVEDYIPPHGSWEMVTICRALPIPIARQCCCLSSRSRC